MDKSKNSIGRPSKFTPELGDAICELLSMGWSLRRVIEKGEEESGVKMPSLRTVYSWLRLEKDFLHQYTRAKDDAVQAEIEMAQDIADDGRNDWMEIWDKEGHNVIGWKVNNEAVQRSKLRVDLIKWKASKLKPRVYGNKVDVTSGGKRLENAPLVVSDIKSREENSSGDIILEEEQED